ncbi:unnamed protein product [Natator depressus]
MGGRWSARLSVGQAAEPRPGSLMAAAEPARGRDSQRAAEGCSVPLPDPASWVEGENVWVLELQPFSDPSAGDEAVKLEPQGDHS